MIEVNKKYRILIEVLTPLNIGAGAEKDLVKGIDYIRKDGEIRKLSVERMVNAGIDTHRLASYYAEKNADSVCKLIGSKIDDVTEKQWTSPADTDNDIKSFIKSQLTSVPIIPGSSLKGAIRSILFSYLRDYQKSTKDVFGKVKDGGDFMRFIKISDVEFDDTILVNTKIFNLRQESGVWQGGWKHGGKTDSRYSPTGFNTVYEVIEPSQKGTGFIMLSDIQFKNYVPAVGIDRKKQEKLFDINNLFRVINRHTMDYLEKELDFFNHYNQAEKSDKIIDSINSLIDIIPVDGSSCILKMSAGSGFHSITGDWQFDEYYGGSLGKGKYKGEKPKSRKIAITNDGNLSMMGFVRISIADEQAADEIQQRHNAIIGKAIDELKISKKEEKKIQEEKRKAKHEYDECISNVKKLKDIGNYTQALDECDKAGKLCPYESEYISLRKQIELALANKEKSARLIAEQQNSAEEARAKKIDAGISILDEKSLNGDYKVKNFKLAKDKVNAWLKLSGNIVIPENHIPALRESIKRIYCGTKDRDRKKEGWMNLNGKVWENVSCWIGEEKARELFRFIIGD